jgi:hypothetical protein
LNLLGTTAIALVIGTGAVIAQSSQDLPQKREEAPRAQTPSVPSKDADRPAASEQRPADRLKDRAAQPGPKAGAKEPRRGEAATPAERKQAQEPPQLRDSKQPAKQSQEQPNRGPLDIVRIAPQYREYEYTVVDNRVFIVDPRPREVVDVLDEPGSRASRVQRERVVITREQRETLKQAARRITTVMSSSPSGSVQDSGCLTLKPVPEELVRSNPELGSYRYLAIGKQVVLVDPRQQKIVEVVD